MIQSQEKRPAFIADPGLDGSIFLLRSIYDEEFGRQTGFARGTLSSSGNNGSSLDTVVSPSQTQSWGLDALGNWTSQTTNSTTTTRTFNAQNQTTSVSGGAAPTYDNNGNTISDNGQTFVYDAWNRLVAALSGSTTVASYTYDALGRRISETYSGTSTTNYLYYSPQWQVIEERQNGTGTSNVSQQYVWGSAYIDQMISRDTYTNGSISSTLFVLQDANWNVTALTDSSGNVVERYLYDPYGDVTVLNASWVPVSGNVSAFGWRYGHQGGRLDPVTGWYDFRNRDYIPSEGRWVERDPMGFGGGSADYYNYELTNPINGGDPIGMSDRCYGQSLYEAMQWSFAVGTASAVGLAQGAANVTNSATDAVIGVINLPGRAYNNTIGWIPGAPIAPYVPSPDWSNNLIVEEDAIDHKISRMAGTVAVTAATLAAGGPTASLPKLTIPSGASLLLATPDGALLLGSTDALILG